MGRPIARIARWRGGEGRGHHIQVCRLRRSRRRVGRFHGGGVVGCLLLWSKEVG